jgi:hypothetical protein
MWIIWVVAVIVLIAAGRWAFSGSSSTCSLCHHPMSAHKRMEKSGGGRHHSFCFRCNKECS